LPHPDTGFGQGLPRKEIHDRTSANKSPAQQGNLWNRDAFWFLVIIGAQPHSKCRQKTAQKPSF
jgi:hypothetical protein